MGICACNKPDDSQTRLNFLKLAPNSGNCRCDLILILSHLAPPSKKKKPHTNNTPQNAVCPKAGLRPGRVFITQAVLTSGRRPGPVGALCCLTLTQAHTAPLPLEPNVNPLESWDVDSCLWSFTHDFSVSVSWSRQAICFKKGEKKSLDPKELYFFLSSLSAFVEHLELSKAVRGLILCPWPQGSLLLCFGLRLPIEIPVASTRQVLVIGRHWKQFPYITHHRCPL